MLIYMYILLLVLTLIFFIMGFTYDNPILSITAGGFLFLLGYTLMGVDTGVGAPPGIEFPNGHIEVTNNATLTSTITYTTYSNRTFGFFLQFISFATIFLTLLNMWRGRPS